MTENPPLFSPPKKLPVLLRPFVWLSERITGKTMVSSRILSWTPRLALASALLELAVESRGKKLGKRLAKLVRLQVSYTTACPFCIDMNAFRWREQGITPEELRALKGEEDWAQVPSFSPEEITALAYAKAGSQTPLRVDPALILKVQDAFGPRKTVILGVLIAKVNYWARFSQLLGIPEAGYHEPEDTQIRLKPWSLP